MSSANQYLETVLPGPVVRIGRFAAADLDGPRLSLQASQVDVDYHALLNSPLTLSGVEQLGTDGGLLKGAARFALQMGARMPPESLEKQGIAILCTGRVKEKLLSTLTDALRKIGLAITFRDMVLEVDSEQEPQGNEKAADAQNEGFISDVFEDPLMDALVAYLRDSVR